MKVCGKIEVNFHTFSTIMLEVGLLHVHFTSWEGPLLSGGCHYSQSVHGLKDKGVCPCQESNSLVMLMTDLSQFLLR